MATKKVTPKKKEAKTLTTAQKECVLLFYNYTPNPLMEVMFGEKCYNWTNPKEPNSLSMSDVAKTIRFTEIENINDETKLEKFIQLKLKK
jgi:hypothetical protein